MKFPRVLWLAALLGVSVTAFGATAAPTPSLTVEHAWIRWMPANLPEAGYLVIQNHGNQQAALVGASSPAFKQVVPMLSKSSGGADSMVNVKEIVIPPHGTTAIRPGGYHLMLMHAERALKPGDTVPITLHFRGGDSVSATFRVRPADAQG